MATVKVKEEAKCTRNARGGGKACRLHAPKESAALQLRDIVTFVLPCCCCCCCSGKATAEATVTAACALLLAFPDDDIISLNERTCESQIETHQWSQLMHQQ